jgi:hypothetical protein
VVLCVQGVIHLVLSTQPIDSWMRGYIHHKPEMQCHINTSVFAQRENMTYFMQLKYCDNINKKKV